MPKETAYCKRAVPRNRPRQGRQGQPAGDVLRRARQERYMDAHLLAFTALSAAK
jgi:hypothetical protein